MEVGTVCGIDSGRERVFLNCFDVLFHIFLMYFSSSVHATLTRENQEDPNSTKIRLKHNTSMCSYRKRFATLRCVGSRCYSEKLELNPFEPRLVCTPQHLVSHQRLGHSIFRLEPAGSSTVTPSNGVICIAFSNEKLF